MELPTTVLAMRSIRNVVLIEFIITVATPEADPEVIEETGFLEANSK